MVSPQNIRAGSAHVELWVNDKMTAGLRRASMSVRRFGRLTEDISRRLLRAGTLMAVPLAAAGRQFGMFETQMAEVSTMLDLPSKHMEEFSQQILAMSIQFGKGTDELSKGLYAILSATIPASDALGVLDVSTRAAVAGLTDAGGAAQTIVGVLNAYGMSADQAQDVSDILFKTVKRGMTTFSELAGFVGKATSIAATAGVKFEELGSAIALVTGQNIPTEIAITGIRQAMATMIKPAKESADLFRELFGMEMDVEAIKKMGGLQRFLLHISRSTTKKQQGVLFRDMRSLLAMLPLISEGEVFHENMQEMEDRAGSAANAYAKMASTISHQFNQLKAAAKAVLVVIGEELKPVMGDLFANLLKLTFTVTTYIKQNSKMIFHFAQLTVKVLAAGVGLRILAVGLQSVATVIHVLFIPLVARMRGFLIPVTAVATAVKLLTHAFGGQISVLEALAAGFGIYVGSLLLYKGALIGAKIAVVGFNVAVAASTAIMALFNPFLLSAGLSIVALVGGVAALLFLLSKSINAFVDWGKDLGDLVNDAKLGIQGVVDAIAAGEWELATEIAVDSMKLIWLDFWKWLEEGFEKANKGMWDFAEDVEPTVGMPARNMITEIKRGTADTGVGVWRAFQSGLGFGNREAWEAADLEVHRKRIAADAEWAAETGMSRDLQQSRIDEIRRAQSAALTPLEQKLADRRKELAEKAEEAAKAAEEKREENAAAQAERDEALQNMLTRGADLFDIAGAKKPKPPFDMEALLEGLPKANEIMGEVEEKRMREMGTQMSTGALNAMAAVRLGMEAGASTDWMTRNVTANEKTAENTEKIVRKLEAIGATD